MAGGRAIKAGSAFVEVGIKNRIAKGARAVQADLDKLSQKIGRMGGSMMKLSGMLSVPLVGAVTSFSKTGAELHKLSQQTGIAADKLSALKFAASQTGANFDSLEGALEELNIRLGETIRDGTGPMAEALKTLGVDAQKLSAMNPLEQFMEIGDALSGIQDQAKRGFLADELLGGDAFRLLPLLRQGRDGMEELMGTARELGVVMSSEDAKAAAEFTAAMNRLWEIAKAVSNAIGGALVPALQKVAGMATVASSGIAGFVKENKGFIQTAAGVVAGIGIIGGALVGLSGFLSLASFAVGGIATVIGGLTSPIGLAIAAVAGLGYAFFKYTDLGGRAIEWLKGRFAPLVQTVKDAIGGITDAIAAGDMQKAWELATDLMEVIWLDLTGGIKDAWGSAMNWILDIGSTVAEKIGMVFESLAGVLGGLLDGYKSYYDAVYNYTSEKLGAPVPSGSAFSQQFGGAESSLRGSIEGVREFGSTMAEDAAARKRLRAAELAESTAQREARIADLREKLAKSGTDTAKVSEQPAKEDDKADKRVEREYKALGDSLKSAIREDMPQDFGTEAGGRETSTFSAAGSFILGMGPSSSPELRALQQIAKNTQEIANAARPRADSASAPDDGWSRKDTADMRSNPQNQDEADFQSFWNDFHGNQKTVAETNAGLNTAMLNTNRSPEGAPLLGGVSNHQTLKELQAMNDKLSRIQKYTKNPPRYAVFT